MKIMARASATVRAARSDRTVALEPLVRLVVTAGPDTGKAFVLDGTQAPRVLLGTSPACELVLADRQISRRHLSFELANGQLRVRDLGSTNGTKIRGVSIAEAFLHGGETLELGESVIEVVRDDEHGEPFVSDETGFGRYLGRSVAMRRLYATCEKLAKSQAPLVIEGETGTGKELLAEVLHEEGPRAEGPFVVFDCASVSPAEAEVVLFGREGSPDSELGLFEEANGGTLLIDEIGELDAGVQPKLLRAIERGEIRRVGGTRSLPIDVRFISTSRRDLDREVGEGHFREDLFFRIAVTRIELPPLRKRAGDVEFLAAHFWALGGSSDPLPRSNVDRLRSYEWPGNVRELSNFITRLRAVGPTERSSQRAGEQSAPASDFIDRVVGEHLPLGPARERVIAEFERRYVEDAFVRNGRNVTRAAEAAGIARRYFRTLRARQRG
jgi:DNA-binding NtrC family response regulator